MTDLSIKEMAAEFDERILDRWGNEFRFDHVKGLAEWLKNAVDAYIREGWADEDQVVFVRFLMSKGKTPTEIQCIDFVGMTKAQIDTAFKRWGDPDASGKLKHKVYGGHGNGGKFYMRQMFRESRFITYRDGKLNVFGFSKNKKYGYAKGFVDKKISIGDALAFAGIDHLKLPEELARRLAEGETGFTVVIGEGLQKASRKNSAASIIARLKVHPQARRILARVPVLAVTDTGVVGAPVIPDPIEPKEGFEGPFEFPIPEALDYGGDSIEMSNASFAAGKLTLYTSAEPFSSHGDRSVLNCVDVLGDVGCLASYRIHELGFIPNSAQTEFLYGECRCPILEDPDDDCVRNDREKLIDNERTRALLDWIRQKVSTIADQLAEDSDREQKEQDLKQSSQFNELLNKWKNKFMSKLYGEIFSGSGDGSGSGGSGGGGSGGGGKGGKGKDGRKGEQNQENDGGGSGDKKDRGPRFPRVLLSNHDVDPLHPETGQSVSCDPRHPPVYQRDEDVDEGIFWINTQAPFAGKILHEFKAESARWRDYLFHRYVDIIVKQAIYDAGKREMELTPSSVDDLLDRVTTQVYENASENLYDFLFLDHLDGNESSDYSERSDDDVQWSAANQTKFRQASTGDVAAPV